MVQRDIKKYTYVWGLILLLIVFVVFQNYGFGSSLVFGRNFVYLWLIMSIIAGAGLITVKKFTLPSCITTKIGLSTVTKNSGKILYFLVIFFVLVSSFFSRYQIPYYHMIDNEDYHSFVWIKENISDKYRKAILDPWKATAFNAISGKYIYTQVAEQMSRSDYIAYDFLNGGCINTTLLKKNNISIVYTNENCNNPDLVEVAENIYLLK